MHGHGILHLDEYKRSENKSIIYAFQLDLVFVKRRSDSRTKDLCLHRLVESSVWTCLAPALFITITPFVRPRGLSILRQPQRVPLAS